MENTWAFNTNRTNVENKNMFKPTNRTNYEFGTDGIVEFYDLMILSSHSRRTLNSQFWTDMN